MARAACRPARRTGRAAAGLPLIGATPLAMLKPSAPTVVRRVKGSGWPLSGCSGSRSPRPSRRRGDLIKDSDTQHFAQDVIQASQSQPVIVDFWAPWCGPCKQLGPLLEKAVRAANGKVRLVKINIDENPELAQQLRIQSIPTVYAFIDGQPVDGFAGAQPESQIKAFVERLGGGPIGPGAGGAARWSRPGSCAEAGDPSAPPGLRAHPRRASPATPRRSPALPAA